MTEQDDITDMKKCRTGRRWMIGLLLGLGMILGRMWQQTKYCG